MSNAQPNWPETLRGFLRCELRRSGSRVWWLPLLVYLSFLSPSAFADRLYSAYWYVDPSTEALLEITNNNEVDSVSVTPVLKPGGADAEVELAPVSLAPGEIARIPLRAQLAQRNLLSGATAELDKVWGNGTEALSRWGSAFLDGASTAGVSAWIVSESPTRSLSTASYFRRSGQSSGRLFTHWWLPTPETRSFYILQNTTNAAVKVHAVEISGGQRKLRLTVEIAGQQSTKLDLAELAEAEADVGTLEFWTEGGEEALLGRFVEVDDTLGFSVSEDLQDSTLLVTNELQMPGGPMGLAPAGRGFPEGASFKTVLAIGNRAATERPVVVTLFGRSAQGLPHSWQAPTLVLPPLSTTKVDLSTYLPSQTGLVAGFGSAGISHNANPGEISAEAFTVDPSLSFSLNCPLSDIATAASHKIAVTFDLEGSKNTLLMVKNTSDETVGYSFALHYSHQGVQQMYMSQLLELAGQELVAIDLKDVRDRGLPGASGEILPTGLLRGSAAVAATAPVILGGDPTLDPDAGTVRQCQELCNTNFSIRSRFLCGDILGPLREVFPLGDLDYELVLEIPLPPPPHIPNYPPRFNCLYRQCEGACPRFLDAAAPHCTPGLRRRTVIKVRHWFLFEHCQSNLHINQAVRCFSPPLD